MKNKSTKYPYSEDLIESSYLATRSGVDLATLRAIRQRFKSYFGHKAGRGGELQCQQVRDRVEEDCLRHWRYGLSQSRVKMLNFVEFKTLVNRATFIMNKRPLGIRNKKEGDMIPITPNQLLMNSSNISMPGE